MQEASLTELQFEAFGQLQRIIYLDAQVSHSALQLGVAKQELAGAKVAGLLVEQGHFRAAHTMSAIGSRIEAD
ncbi:hypothetical protein GCM10022211_14180 [Sphingomonas humi]|uniref:Uncharacterized protein n=1 Tax=Sphingomonas humi TaxID=335630 RepID=A0ABP7RXR8_9SPHN